MATHRPSILGWATNPGTSGDVFWEPSTVKQTNDAFRDGVWVFNDTATRIGLHGRFRVPDDYVGSAQLLVRWSSTATTGDVEWDFDYRAIAVGEGLDQAGTQETVNVADTAPAAAHDHLEAVLALTSGNFAAGDEVRFALYRDGTDAGDTMAAAAYVVGVYFEYADA